MNRPMIEELATKVADKLSARVLLYNGPIGYDGWGKLTQAMGTGDTQNSLLILTTDGGNANAAYQISRMLQERSQEFILFIPRFCKSAGTLLALGASYIIMSPIAEIGPLDVQLRERDEIWELRSGLVSKTALEVLAEETYSVFETVLIGIKDLSDYQVSLEMSANIASKITGQVMAPIYGQINPDNLGRDLRNLRIATEYGNRLAEYGGNVEPNTIKRLVENYPSHDFVIDAKETATLFTEVKPSTEEMAKLCLELGEEIYVLQDPPIVKRLDKIREDTDAEEKQVKTDQQSDKSTEIDKDKGTSSD